MRPESVQTITQPASEPLSLTEAKLHCRVDISDDDTLISGLIAAARAVGETETQRRFISQTVEAKYANWPGTGEAFVLPGPPLSSVTYVKYYDSDGTEQTLSTSIYETDTASEPGRVALKPDQEWPTLQDEKDLPIRICYVAGYADADTFADALPQAKTAMLMCVADWYRFRENIAPGTNSKVPYAACMLFGQCAMPWGY